MHRSITINRDFQVDVTFIYADTCMSFIFIILQLAIVTDVKRRFLVDGRWPSSRRYIFLFLICHSNYKYINQIIQEQTDFSLEDKIESWKKALHSILWDNEIAYMGLYRAFLFICYSIIQNIVLSTNEKL